MSQINVGLVGFGLAGSVFHAPLIVSEKRMRLAAVATSRPLPEEFSSAKTFADPLEMIASHEVDLVVIASPNTTHAPLARTALMAGKHVVVDKPFALNLYETDELLTLARLQTKMLTVFQNRRFDGNFLTVRELLANDAIGDVRYCEIHYDRFRPAPKSGWRERPEPGSGVLFDLGPHLLDQALCLFGKPDTVMADVVLQRDGVSVDDYFHIILGYGRKRVVVHASTLVPKPGARLIAHGTRGSLYQYGMDEQEPQLAGGLRPGDIGWGQAPGAYATISDDAGDRSVPLLPGSYQTFYQAVASSIQDGTPPPVSLEDARTLMAVLAAARESSLEGRKIALL